jgi:hypothetical protein
MEPYKAGGVSSDAGLSAVHGLHKHGPAPRTLIGSELSADVFARYLRAVGEEVVFVSGSDEHGTR